MKKNLFFFITLFSLTFGFPPFYSQEIVIFQDDRALVVKSHSEKDGFVYLKVNEGEFAVPKRQVKEIRKTDTNLAEVSIPQNAPGFTRENPSDEKQTAKTGVRVPMKRPQGMSHPVRVGAANDKSDEDDEDTADSDQDTADEEDDEAEPQGPPSRVIQPQSAAPGKVGRPVPPVAKRR